MNRHTRLLPAQIIRALCSLFLLTVAGFSADKDDKDQSDIEKRIDNATKVLDEIMATPRRAFPTRS